MENDLITVMEHYPHPSPLPKKAGRGNRPVSSPLEERIKVRRVCDSERIQNNSWQSLPRPIKVLAPMAGYTDSAFRILARRNGADLVVTELISADAIYFGAKNWFCEDDVWQSKRGYDPTLELLRFLPEERPLIIQLFGKDPDHFAFAAKWIAENLKPDGIDINMGCPARKVVGSDHGAALLKNPELACTIVRTVSENSNGISVSVKTRLGWDKDTQILEFAPLLMQAGISAIIVHGRTYQDGFKHTARWERIYDLKELLPELVVIGNGDIRSHAEIMTKSKCQMSNGVAELDGLAVGRAAFGKPYIFRTDSISQSELVGLIREHAKLAYQSKGDKGLIELRKHLVAYLKGFPGAKELRQEAVRVETLDDIEKLLENL